MIGKWPETGLLFAYSCWCATTTDRTFDAFFLPFVPFFRPHSFKLFHGPWRILTEKIRATVCFSSVQRWETIATSRSPTLSIVLPLLRSSLAFLLMNSFFWSASVHSFRNKIWPLDGDKLQRLANAYIAFTYVLYMSILQNNAFTPTRLSEYSFLSRILWFRRSLC